MPIAQAGDQLLDAALPDLRAPGVLDGVDVLLPEPEWQAIEAAPGFGNTVERDGQVP